MRFDDYSNEMYLRYLDIKKLGWMKGQRNSIRDKILQKFAS